MCLLFLCFTALLCGCFSLIQIDTNCLMYMLSIRGQMAVYGIETGKVLAGKLPPNKHKLVVAWLEIHREDLLADWQLAILGQDLFPIRGLDQ